jgi:hypothetical protein
MLHFLLFVTIFALAFIVAVTASPPERELRQRRGILADTPDSR